MILKTREELLNEMDKFRWTLTSGQSKVLKSGLHQILAAPTEKQTKCEYCHGGRKAKPIVADSSDFLAFDKSGIVAFGNDGSVTTGENYTKIKYCPMCARKLGDE
ncbi:MAG: hypothetical protein ABF690_00425 [Liquorilactobacillus nagelii]|uniref:hypothetical protein n=1 Tax=Oenococcus sicerae TaxID=2203724 RepID=UPI0039E99C0E